MCGFASASFPAQARARPCVIKSRWLREKPMSRPDTFADFLARIRKRGIRARKQLIGELECPRSNSSQARRDPARRGLVPGRHRRRGQQAGHAQLTLRYDGRTGSGSAIHRYAPGFRGPASARIVHAKTGAARPQRARKSQSSPRRGRDDRQRGRTKGVAAKFSARVWCVKHVAIGVKQLEIPKGVTVSIPRRYRIDQGPQGHA